MKLASWITFFYGLLIIAGGIIGHMKAASTASLIVGVIFGVLLLMCAAGIYRDHLLPAYIGLILILLLDAFFTYRWLYTLSFFPTGILCLISLAVFIIVAILIRNHLKKQTKKRG